MRIDEMLAARSDPVFSFEFFPPKTPAGEENLLAALAALRELDPAFVSVTKTGASTQTQTIDLVRRIRAEHGIEAAAHFTCLGVTPEELAASLEELRESGIENVIALRGDQRPGMPTPGPGGLRYARELVELIGAAYPFCTVAACYPETHPEAADAASDLAYLRAKVDAGARVLITNLFFSNAAYFDFVERAREGGIEVPILAGIMPITNAAQITRFAAIGGITIPPALAAALEAREGDAEAVADLGVAYATLQCAELLAAGVPGIHFYTLNRSPATRAILSSLRLMRPWETASRR